MTYSWHIPQPWYSAKKSGGNPQLPASPWGTKGLDYASSAPTFKLPLQVQAPKPPISKRQCCWPLQDPQDYRKQRSGSQWTYKPSPWLSSQDSGERAQATMPISQYFSGRGLSAYFKGYCLRVWLLISLHLYADWDPPLWDTDGFWHTLSYLSVQDRLV